LKGEMILFNFESIRGGMTHCYYLFDFHNHSFGHNWNWSFSVHFFLPCFILPLFKVIWWPPIWKWNQIWSIFYCYFLSLLKKSRIFPFFSEKWHKWIIKKFEILYLASRHLNKFLKAQLILNPTLSFNIQ
jgi:hypothetical protein